VDPIVGAGSAADGVVAVAAVQLVAVGAAGDPVVARPTVDVVGPAAGGDRVVARTAEDSVVAATPITGVRTVACEEVLPAIPTRQGVAAAIPMESDVTGSVNSGAHQRVSPDS
jgi:hypothetical protein